MQPTQAARALATADCALEHQGLRLRMQSISDDQADLYLNRADAYDALVSAEDADGQLERELRSLLPTAVVADIGAGTGRVSRLLAGHATHTHLVERAAPMLEFAANRLSTLGLSFDAHLADARELPLTRGSVDAAVAGWVFGHFRHWMPEGWRAEVDAAVDEMARVVVAGGPIVIIETLGTGHETPREHPLLDEYFAHLEERGFTRTWLRTDYHFDTTAEAARVLGSFFGEPMSRKLIANDWSRVPECTGLWRRQSSS